jgi:hypothetical protein
MIVELGRSSSFELSFRLTNDRTKKCHQVIMSQTKEVSVWDGERDAFTEKRACLRIFL